MPPLNGLPVLLPPPVPDSGPNYWSDYLYRYPEVPKGALNDLVDDSSTGLVLDDPDESEDGSSGDEANPLDEGLIDQDPSAQYAMLYDTVRLDAVRTLYGWILDENRYEIASGSPIQFQQIRPETGEEIFAPRNFERGDYQSFSFAKNLRNEIELGVREMRNSGAGDTEALREYVLWLLNNAIPEPVAFGYAEELARKLIDLAVDDPLSWLALGQVWERTFRFDEAFTLYGRLSSEDLPLSIPDLGLPIEDGRFERNAAMRVGMARIMRRIGMDVEAEKLLRRADQLQPGDEVTLHALGALLLDNNQVQDALQYLERVADLPLQRNSDLSLANGYALGRAYLATGQWERSSEAFKDTVSAAGGKDAAVGSRKGMIAASYLSGKFGEALMEAEEAIAEYGADAELLYLRALATAADGGSAAEVVRDLRASAAAAPLDAGLALSALAFWYDVLGMGAEASEALESALELQPDLQYGRYLKARWDIRDGQSDVASEELRKLVAEGPRCSGILIELGWLFHEIGAYELAEVAFRRSAVSRPEWVSKVGQSSQWADLELRRGLNQMSLEGWEQAKDHLGDALSLDASQFSAQNSLATVSYALGDLTQAISDFGFLQDNLRQTPEDVQYEYAKTWQERIQAHARLRRWEDPFDGNRLRPGWDVQSDSRNGVSPSLRGGKLAILGTHDGSGETRATRRVTALHFQSFSGDLEIGTNHKGDAGLFLAIETRQKRATWLFRVFRDRDGYLVYDWKQGAKTDRKRVGRKLSLGVPIPISFELDRELSTPMLTIKVDGEKIYEGTAAVLKSSSGSLVYGLYAFTSNALPVDTTLDNVGVVYSKP
jgi:Tfp pilus assembly protein PilF